MFRECITAIAAAATFVLASPCSAATTVDIFGIGQITSSTVQGYCAWDGSFCNPPEAGPYAIGEKFNFQISLYSDEDFGPAMGGAGFANMSVASGYYFLVDLQFTGKRLDSGSMLMEGADDVCGGGASIRIAGSRISFGETHCGYDPAAFPYPFIHTGGLGRITEIQLNGVAVPEPSTWGMLLLGFAAIGLAFRSGLSARYALR